LSPFLTGSNSYHLLKRVKAMKIETNNRLQEFVSITSGTLAQSFIQPEGKIFLLYGDRVVFKLSMIMASQILSNNVLLAVIDGCNGFDVHTITKFARERRLDPDTLLRHIFISRGFTCYQMEAAITNRLPVFLNARNSRTGIVLGLLDTFYDEQVSSRQVQQILTRVLLTLQEIKKNGVSLLLVCYEWNVMPAERNNLFRRLKESVDNVYHLIPDDIPKTQLYIEQPVQKKGKRQHGTNRTYLHQPDRQ
jgi:hypothetical protein